MTMEQFHTDKTMILTFYDYDACFYVETLGLSTVFLEEFCTESLTVSMS